MSHQRLRAVFLSSSRDAWGAEESLLVLAKRLESTGIDCRLWTSNPELRDRWLASVGTPAVLIADQPSDALREVTRWERRLSSSCRGSDWRPDVVVVFNLGLAPLALVHRLLHRRRPRFVLDLHDYLPTTKGRFKLAALATAFDRVIAISRFSSGQIGSDRSKVVVLTRPIEPRKGPTHGSGGRTVAIVGRLDPDKNIELAVDAMVRIPDARLTVRGSATEANVAYAEALAMEAVAKLGERVHFTGRVSNEAVLENVDVLLVTNAQEAMGRTVLEAQLQGRVVVVPDSGGAFELVDDETTGFVYRANDAAAAAAALERALSNENGVRESAKRFATAVSDPDRYAERYAEALKR